MLFCSDYGESYAEDREEALDMAQASFDRHPEVRTAHAGMTRMRMNGRPERPAVYRRRLERMRIEIAAENSDMITDVDPEDIVI